MERLTIVALVLIAGFVSIAVVALSRNLPFRGKVGPGSMEVDIGEADAPKDCEENNEAGESKG